jgi:hypothetical protein
MGHVCRVGQTPQDPLIDCRARKQALSTLTASFVSATATSGNVVQPQVWRAMLSLHLRLSIYDDTILPLCCPRCHTTMDSEGDHAMLSCRRAPCAGCLGISIFKSLLGEEVCVRRGSIVPFEAPMLIIVTRTTWRSGCMRHPLRTLCRAIPRRMSPSSLPVGGMRRRSQEDRLHLLSKRTAMTL